MVSPNTPGKPELLEANIKNGITGEVHNVRAWCFSQDEKLEWAEKVNECLRAMGRTERDIEQTWKTIYENARKGIFEVI